MTPSFTIRTTAKELNSTYMIHKIDPYYADNIAPDQAIIIKHDALTKVVSAHCTDDEYSQLFGHLIDSEPAPEMATAIYQNRTEFDDFTIQLEDYKIDKIEPTAENIMNFAREHGYNYDLFVLTFNSSSYEDLIKNLIYLDKCVGMITHEVRLESGNINEEEYYA